MQPMAGMLQEELSVTGRGRGGGCGLQLYTLLESCFLTAEKMEIENGSL